MPVFQYKAIQTDGTVTQGQIEASGRADAFKTMEARGLRPVRLAEANGGNGANGNGHAAPKINGHNKRRVEGPEKQKEQPAPARAEEAPSKFKLSLGGGKKITARMLENFTRLLSSLLAAGVALSRALVILTREASTPAARDQWKLIHDRVVDGMPLATAMAQSPETFPRVYVAMVEAGEAGGFLDVVLGQIADFQAREKEMRGKVLTALLYPIILLVLALAVLVFLLVFFIPRFQTIFQGFGAKLPLLTQVIVSVSELMRSYGLFMVVGIVVGFYLIRSWFVSETGRRVWEGWILRAPIVGPLVAQFAMARFSRMLGTLLGAGVPLINGLNVARRSIGNQILVDAVSNSIERVKEGKPLGPSLGECRALFSGSTLEMISVAEESGRLDTELVRIANVTESDLDRQLKTAVALTEPIMLFFIAAFIGTIFIGMVIPIFSLQDHIK
jgi:type IV pilus assembly protein PilC